MTASRSGKVITFYSFKGGVGRTMALANVAFLAARNGHRVLVMDWDLEAPGLAYYFKGLLSSTAWRELREAPGILDVVGEWQSASSDLDDSARLQTFVERLNHGEVFRECVRDLCEPEVVPANGVFHYFGPGARAATKSGGRNYEQALAEFSWQRFYKEQSGGFLIQRLREWAKANYDYVLIDSRTGYADVAGICTVHLPDAVALCFIYNKQNIEGIATVASAIRSERHDTIELRAIPMRVPVGGQSSSAEADAYARAVAQFVTVGQFAEDALKADMLQLAIHSADNIPYYETIAQLLPPLAKHSSDTMTGQYAHLAAVLLGTPINILPLSEDQLKLARRRLEPKIATAEYVATLAAAEPGRAVEELLSLTDGAYESVADGMVPEYEYVIAVAEACFSVPQVSQRISVYELLLRMLELLRVMVLREASDKWRLAFASYAERFLSVHSYRMDFEGELALREELDGILSAVPTIAAKMRRIANKTAAANLYLVGERLEGSMQAIGELRALISEVNRETARLSPGQLDELMLASTHASLIEGDVHQHSGMNERAREEFLDAMRRLHSIDPEERREDLAAFRFEIHRRLALLGVIPLDQAVEHALRAAATKSSEVIFYFEDLARVVLRDAPTHSQVVVRFVLDSLGGQGRRSRSGARLLATFYGRQANAAEGVLTVLKQLVDACAQTPGDSAPEALALMAEAAEQVMETLSRRSQTVGVKAARSVDEACALLLGSLDAAYVPYAADSYLAKARDAARDRRMKDGQGTLGL
jgi:hypothetical protein